MSSKFQYYNTGQDSEDEIYNNAQRAQTFTPSIRHRVTSVKLYLRNFNSPSGTLDIEITATSGGEPSGAALCSGTITCAELSGSLDWYEISLGDGCVLDISTMYAIVVSGNVSADPITASVRWGQDTSSPTYSGGTRVWSNDGGSSWNVDSSVDELFEEWGVGMVGNQIIIIA